MKKEELLFLELNTFGKLYYHNVYSFYEQPLTFTALNEFGQVYFCYSLGVDDNYTYDQWIVVPISEAKVHQLEQKDIPIIKAIKQTTTSSVFLINLCLNNGKIEENKVLVKNLDFIFPDADIFISENVNYDGLRKHTHRIRFARKSNSPIISTALDLASQSFNEFCRNFLRNFDIRTSFYTHDAIVGSFVYRVKASDIENLQLKGHQILSKVSNKQEFIKALDHKQVDLRLARGLFDTLLANDLSVELFEEESTDLILSLKHEYIIELLAEVDERIGKYLDSSMVPQADNLDRIKKFLELTSNNIVVTSDSLKVEPRQVSYYRDACQLLSLVHSYGKITPIGYKALTAENEEVFLNVIKRQFEETECGYIWMLDQEVDLITDIDENSAADFLISNCNGLSESTSRRRAQTLKSWVKKFKKYS